MALVPLQPRSASARPDRPIAIVASLYNRELVDGLVTSANEELEAQFPGIEVPVFRVPGAFEVPVTVAKLCGTGAYSAVIALGVIIRGATAHADLIGASITEALQQLAIQHQLPILHEILLVDSEDDARVRCLGTEMNRGTEAARAAAAMTDLFRQMDS